MPVLRVRRRPGGSWEFFSTCATQSARSATGLHAVRSITDRARTQVLYEEIFGLAPYSTRGRTRRFVPPLFILSGSSREVIHTLLGRRRRRIGRETELSESRDPIISLAFPWAVRRRRGKTRNPVGRWVARHSRPWVITQRSALRASELPLALVLAGSRETSPPRLLPQTFSFRLGPITAMSTSNAGTAKSLADP